MNRNNQSISKMKIISLIVIPSILLAACGGASSPPLVVIEAELENVAAPQVELSDSAAGNSAESDQTVEEVTVEESSDELGSGDLEKDEFERVVPEVSVGSPQLKASQAGYFDRYGEGVKVLEFFAFWCPNCKALASRIHGLEEAYAGEVEFTFLDIDDPANKALKDEYGFYYQPFVLVIDGQGEVHAVWVGGGIDVYEVQAEIERLLTSQG
jgi:thiol-disulfide isomerase/thioredoxin